MYLGLLVPTLQFRNSKFGFHVRAEYSPWGDPVMLSPLNKMPATTSIVTRCVLPVKLFAFPILETRIRAFWFFASRMFNWGQVARFRGICLGKRLNYPSNTCQTQQTLKVLGHFHLSFPPIDKQIIVHFGDSCFFVSSYHWFSCVFQQLYTKYCPNSFPLLFHASDSLVKFLNFLTASIRVTFMFRVPISSRLKTAYLSLRTTALRTRTMF